MTMKESWLLPEGIDELMPAEANQLEKLHRSLVDRMQSWGYQLVVPPLAEYLDSLLTGTAQSLDLQTFKLTDQMSGRLMGIRADMTPQVARIAAHRLRKESGVLRLCYIGSVLHTLPEGQGTSRNPIQLGAEIYGHAGPESDVESIQLMMDLLQVSGVNASLYLDIGHVGIFRGLANYAGLSEDQEQLLFSALQRKAQSEIEALLASFELESAAHAMLLSLAELNGDASLLARAQQSLQSAPAEVRAALDTLLAIAEMLNTRLPEVHVNYDLAELRGYDYHTGVVFSAYQSGSAQAIALGGRYDSIGEHFGYAQPATGFSLDVKKLVMQLPPVSESHDVIGTVWSNDPAQQQAVEALRAEGHIVTYQLSAQESYTQSLVNQNGHWEVVETGTQTRGK